MPNERRSFQRAFFGGLEAVHFILVRGGDALGGTGLDEPLDFLMCGAVIALEGEDMVGVFADDVGGDILLASHDINGDDAAFEFEGAKRFGDGGNLVGFFIHFDLAQHQSIFRCPGADDVGNGISLVEGAAQGFAVDGDRVVAKGGTGYLYPSDKTVNKARGANSREDAVERVMRGDAVGQLEKGLEPVELGLSEVLNVGEILAHRDHRTQADDQGCR